MALRCHTRGWFDCSRVQVPNTVKVLLQVAAILEALGGDSAPSSRDNSAAGAPAVSSTGSGQDGEADVRERHAHRRRGWALLADPAREDLVEAERQFLTAALALLQAWHCSGPFSLDQ